jgi:hypothetical protein
VVHSRPGAAAVKSRSSRSGISGAVLAGRVVECRRRRPERPSRPWAAISQAIRLTALPALRDQLRAHTRGAVAVRRGDVFDGDSRHEQPLLPPPFGRETRPAVPPVVEPRARHLKEFARDREPPQRCAGHLVDPGELHSGPARSTPSPLLESGTPSPAEACCVRARQGWHRSSVDSPPSFARPSSRLACRTHWLRIVSVQLHGHLLHFLRSRSSHGSSVGRNQCPKLTGVH